MNIRIITYNINGIRSAIKKGFLDWLKSNPADIICLQEIKAQESDIKKELFEKSGYRPFIFSAERKGYSGVAILSRVKPDNIIYGHNNKQSDSEGRVLRADLGNISVISAYFPSGTSGNIRQTYKYQWLD